MNRIPFTATTIDNHLFIPYGSRTRDTHLKNSDLDILFVCDEDLFNSSDSTLTEYISSHKFKERLYLHFKDQINDTISIDITPCKLYDTVDTPLGKFNRFQIHYPQNPLTVLTIPEYINRYTLLTNDSFSKRLTFLIKILKYLIHPLFKNYPSIQIEKNIIKLLCLFKKKDDAFLFYQKLLL